MAEKKRCAARNNHNSAIEIFSDKGKLLGTGRLIEYSAKGASFCAPEGLVKGPSIRVRLRLFEKGILDVTAEVVWERKDKNATVFGIKFNSVERIHPTGELKGLRDNIFD